MAKAAALRTQIRPQPTLTLGIHGCRQRLDLLHDAEHVVDGDDQDRERHDRRECHQQGLLRRHGQPAEDEQDDAADEGDVPVDPDQRRDLLIEPVDRHVEVGDRRRCATTWTHVPTDPYIKRDARHDRHQHGEVETRRSRETRRPLRASRDPGT